MVLSLIRVMVLVQKKWGKHFWNAKPAERVYSWEKLSTSWSCWVDWIGKANVTREA